MIIWNDKGFLVAVFVFGCSLAANLITNSLAGTDQYWEQHKWPFGVSLLASAALSWFVGRDMASRKAKTLIDKETGEEVVLEPYHAFFFIRMHWWGPILTTIALVILVMDLVKE